MRTAAEGATADELQRDVDALLEQWDAIEAEPPSGPMPRACSTGSPTCRCGSSARSSTASTGASSSTTGPSSSRSATTSRAVSPELADRVEYYDPAVEALPIFERYHVHEQLHKALDRKVWLPSGGSLIIERTEALTVIDVNTGKNVGTSNLEETVYRNNLEAAEEIARQLRLRDIGGIIVIDFIDMEIRENRDKVAAALRDALARDKTRTQVFDISELGLVEMTRKRISEGLIESLSDRVRRLRRAGRDLGRLGAALGSRPYVCVIKTGGKQERVAEGQRLRVELLGEPVGAEVSLRAGPGGRRRHRAGHARPSWPAPRSPPRWWARSKGPRSTASPTRTSRTSAAGGVTASTTPRSRSPPSRPPAEARQGADMSKTKGGGSTRNGRDSNAQRLGVKEFDGTDGDAPAPSSCASGAPSSTPARTWAGAATTRCSPRPTAWSSSALAGAASTSTS